MAAASLHAGYRPLGSVQVNVAAELASQPGYISTEQARNMVLTWTFFLLALEPARGIEPLTSCLQDRCSTS
jgi:hypothetical protein